MGRAPCCEKVGLKKGRWTAEEDEILTNYIHANGEGSWRSLPKNAGLLRCGKSCRLRWINYLRADLKRGNISAEEEHIIINLHASLGNRWSMIASHLAGRTDNEIKNYWNSHLSRKIRKLRRPVPVMMMDIPKVTILPKSHTHSRPSCLEEEESQLPRGETQDQDQDQDQDQQDTQEHFPHNHKAYDDEDSIFGGIDGGRDDGVLCFNDEGRQMSSSEDGVSATWNEELQSSEICGEWFSCSNSSLLSCSNSSLFSCSNSSLPSNFDDNWDWVDALLHSNYNHSFSFHDGVDGDPLKLGHARTSS